MVDFGAGGQDGVLAGQEGGVEDGQGGEFWTVLEVGAWGRGGSRVERAKKASRGELTKSSVHRLLKAHGASKRPARGPGAERRSFLHECAGELLVGDALHVHHPVLDREGRPCKACLLSQIDGATRYVPHSYFAFGPRKGEEAKALAGAKVGSTWWRSGDPVQDGSLFAGDRMGSTSRWPG